MDTEIVVNFFCAFERHKNEKLVSGCGTLGRAVASDTDTGASNPVIGHIFERYLGKLSQNEEKSMLGRGGAQVFSAFAFYPTI